MNALIGLMIGAALAVPAGEQKEAPKDLDKLQGIWNVTTATRPGARLAPAGLQAPSMTLVVVGDQYVFSTHAGKFMLDPAKGTVDFDVKAGRYKGTTVPGRYELTADGLKLSMPMSLLKPVRPAELKPGDDPTALVAIVYTFKRDGFATKEQAEAMLKDRTAALPDKGVGVPGGPGFGGAGGAKGVAAPAATLQMLERILERLERIEQRLDAMEKKLAAPREQK